MTGAEHAPEEKSQAPDRPLSQSGWMAGVRGRASTFAALRLLGQGLEFVAFVVFARGLGPSEFGSLSVAYLICRYGGLVGDWGATLMGPRQAVIDHSAPTLHSLVRRRHRVSAGLTLLFVAGAAATGNVALAPLGATIWARGTNMDWLALGRHQPVRSGIPAVVNGLVMVIGASVAGSLASAAVAIALAALAGNVLSISINRMAAMASGAPVKVEGWLLVTVLADQLYATADVILLSALASDADAGIYAAAYRIPNAFMTVVGLLIAGAIPSVVEIVRAAPDRIIEVRRRSLRYGAVAAAAVLLAIPLALYVLPIVFGSAYVEGRGPLAILLVATAVNVTTSLLGPLVLALRPDRLLALASGTIAVANIALNLILIPHAGMAGAALATLIAQVALASFFLWATRPSVVSSH